MIEALKQALKQTGHVMIRLKVKANSASAGMVKIEKNGLLKVNVKSSPEKGKANDELCRWLAKKLAVPTKNVTIINGRTKATKLIKIIV